MEPSIDDQSEGARAATALPSSVPTSGASAASSDRVLHFAVLSLLCLLYLPFTGAYGLWDPWETHYGEVARQMASRNDWISLWWPGSPQDPASGVFFSKPVLTFWLMALSLKVFRLGHASPLFFDEMTVGWRAEWALRLPFVLLGIAGVLATYYLVRRVVSRRAALWSALVLGTSTQWSLITRQAMTDMAFVAPMTLAVVLAGLALLPQREQPEDPSSRWVDLKAELPRKRIQLFGQELSWPHSPTFYGFLALFGLLVMPQLIVNLVQLKSFSIAIRGHGYRVAGPVAMLPFVLLFVLSLLWCAQAKNRRSIYLWSAYAMCGVATLAKGPAGLGMPVLTLGLFLLLSGRLAELLGERRDVQPTGFLLKLPEPIREIWCYQGGLELSRGLSIFLCVAAPWFVAMLARHGLPFWMELIGDNYVHRAQGRHGDRGTFEYYLQQITSGMFPWSGVVAASALWLGRFLTGSDEKDSSRRQLVLLCLAWFVIDFGVVTLVNTKFHHYILPALPALAILAGLLLDELCQPVGRFVRRQQQALMLLVAVPVTYLAGRDLANFPARIGWLFNYDYVNVPNVGRPWPATGLYGDRYEYFGQVFAYALLGTLAVLLLSVLLTRTDTDSEEPAEDASSVRVGWPVLLGLGLLTAGLVFVGNSVAPSPELVTTYSTSKLPTATPLPWRLQLGYLVPAALSALWLIGLLWALSAKLRLKAQAARAAATGIAVLSVFALVWNCWVLDRFMIDISPHWSQKHVFATYFRLRKGPEEPVIAWMMYWRGENFYTCNQIYDHRVEPGEKTVFLGDRNTEKLQEYMRNHPGRRMFFLIERHRLESLRSLLPEAARPTLEVVDDSNNKVFLVRAQL